LSDRTESDAPEPAVALPVKPADGVDKAVSWPSGQPLKLDGDFLKAEVGWTAPGIPGLVGDQRRPVVAGLVPKQLQLDGSASGSFVWKEVFVLELPGGKLIRARDCQLWARADSSPRDSLMGIDLFSFAGEELTLHCPQGLQVHWAAWLLRTETGAEVLRVKLRFVRRPVAATGQLNSGAATPVRLLLWVWDAGAACKANLTAGATSNSGDVLHRQKQPGNCLQVAGSVDGSPLVNLAARTWLTVEHPRATSTIRNETLQMAIDNPEKGVAYFASFGASGPVLPYNASGATGEDAFPMLRRHFQAYLDAARSSPLLPKLHYSTWYDLRREPCAESSKLAQPFCGEAKTMSEERVMERMLSVHRELSSRRLVLEGFLLDDGWDDPAQPWRLHPNNFPFGLATLSAAAKTRGVQLGAWLSPWGGFGKAGKQRLHAGAQRGFESQGGSFHLAGANYYSWFRNATRSLVLDSGVRFLKLDGIGSGATGRGAQNFHTDMDRLMALVHELRRGAAASFAANGKTESKSLWVSLVTGFWPSPFWLLSGDALWRGGPDLGRTGVGSAVQQWITFRDAMVHQWIVQRAPLFPLAGLAQGGIVWSRAEEPGAYLDSYTLEDFACEVWSFFFTGAASQELQIQPSLLTPTHWDILVAAANASRQRAAVLRDSHWVGGNPKVGEVYGYASYACPPCSGVMSWRNPSASKQTITFTLRAALAMPRQWQGGSVGSKWRLRNLWPQEATSATFPGGLRQDGVQIETQARGGQGHNRTLMKRTHGPHTLDGVLPDQVLHLDLAALELRILEVLPELP